MHERYIYTVSSSSAELTVNRVCKGVTQGGVSSPLLWDLYISRILEGIPEKVKASLFADDITLFLNTDNPTEDKIILENAIATLNNNLLKLGLELCASKTVYVHFNNNNIYPGDSEIKVIDTIIKSSPKARFLGVIFDFKLTFEPHISYVKQKCEKAMNIIKFLRGTWWGSDPSTLITFYQSYIRSIIDYGSYIYFPTRKKSKQKLERIQVTAMKLALGYRLSTPNYIALAESKLPTIENRTLFLCKKHIIKNLSNTSSLTTKTIYQYFSNTLFDNKKSPHIFRTCIRDVMCLKHLINTENNFEIFNHEYKTIILNVDINFETGLALKEGEISDESIDLSSINTKYLKIFTDGSKNPYKPSVGSACVCPDLDFSTTKSLPSHTSIFTAEAVAINDALDIALANKNMDIKIFSDSCLTSLKIP